MKYSRKAIAVLIVLSVFLVPFVSLAQNTTLIQSGVDEEPSVPISTNPSITVLSPNGGEIWRAGTTRNISWSSVSVDRVTISLCYTYIFGGGRTCSLLSGIPSTGIINSGTFVWNLDHNYPRFNASNLKIRVRSVDPSPYNIQDESDHSFSVETKSAPTDVITETANGGSGDNSPPSTPPNNPLPYPFPTPTLPIGSEKANAIRDAIQQRGSGSYTKPQKPEVRTFDERATDKYKNSLYNRQNSSSSDSLSDRAFGEEVDEKRAVKLEERRAERSERLDNAKKNRVRTAVTRVIRRISAATERVGNISERLWSRIGKVSDQNPNTDFSGSLSMLDEVDRLLDITHGNLSEVMSIIDAVLDSDDPKEEFEKVKALLKEAQKNVTSAHSVLKEALRLAKEAVSGIVPGGSIQANDNSSLVDDNPSDTNESDN